MQYMYVFIYNKNYLQLESWLFCASVYLLQVILKTTKRIIPTKASITMKNGMNIEIIKILPI